MVHLHEAFRCVNVTALTPSLNIFPEMPLVGFPQALQIGRL